MPDVKIRVEATTRDELDSKTPTESSGKGTTTERLAVASIFAQQAVATTKQIVSASISNIGNFTGDYIKQDNVQRQVETLLQIGAIAVEAYVNPVLALAHIAGNFVKDLTTSVSSVQAMNKQENTLRLLKERAGYPTTNGSRTGE